MNSNKSVPFSIINSPLYPFHNVSTQAEATKISNGINLIIYIDEGGNRMGSTKERIFLKH